MSNLTRVVQAQLIKSFMRYPRKENLFRLGLARYSTVPPTDNTKRKDERPPTPKKKRGILTLAATAAAVGGLGFSSYKIFNDQKASCAGKDDGQCGNECDEDSTCLHKMDEEEQKIKKANLDLEKALKAIKTKAMANTDLALEAYCEAADLCKLFMDTAYCAIEEENLDSTRFEEIWCDVYDLAIKRCEKVKEAIEKGQCAWTLLCKLRQVVEDGKACKYTACNPLLITADEFLSCAEVEILNAKAKMDCIHSESRLVEQYRNLVEDFRRDLKAEMESMLTSNPECKLFLTYNECNMILTHAYKKILRVQKELALVQEEEGDCEEDEGPPPEEQTDDAECCNA